MDTKWNDKLQKYFRNYEKKGDNMNAAAVDDTGAPRSFEIQSRRDEGDKKTEKEGCLKQAANAAGKAKAAVASAYATASCQSKEKKKKKAEKKAFNPNDLNLRHVYTLLQ